MPSSENPFKGLVDPNLEGLKPYTPGKPIEELKRERKVARVVKLASNENPLGPSPKAVKALRGGAAGIFRYQDGYGYELKRSIADRWGVEVENIVLGNGSSEIIELMVRLFVSQGSRVVLADPSFSIYEITVRAQGGKIVQVPLKDHRVDLAGVSQAAGVGASLIILGNPNNPTGSAFDREEWEPFLASVGKTPILLDEAYAEYAENDDDFPSGRDYIAEDRPLVVARTFSKAHGLAALRIGYGLAPKGICDYMNRLRLPFNANGLAQLGAIAALGDETHVRKSVEFNRAGLDRLEKYFEANGIEYLPSSGNFILARVGDGDAVFDRLLNHGVIVRSTSSFNMPEWIRVTVGLAEELDLFEEKLPEVLAELGLKGSKDG